MPPYPGPFANRRAEFIGVFLTNNLPVSPRFGEIAIVTDCAAPFITGNPPTAGGSVPALVMRGVTQWQVLMFGF